MRKCAALSAGEAILIVSLGISTALSSPYDALVFTNGSGPLARLCSRWESPGFG